MRAGHCAALTKPLSQAARGWDCPGPCTAAGCWRSRPSGEQGPARVVGRGDFMPEVFDDPGRLGDELRVVARELPRCDIQVVLEPHPHVAAEDRRDSNHRELLRPYPEGAPARC